MKNIWVKVALGVHTHKHQVKKQFISLCVSGSRCLALLLFVFRAKHISCQYSASYKFGKDVAKVLKLSLLQLHNEFPWAVQLICNVLMSPSQTQFLWKTLV